MSDRIVALVRRSSGSVVVLAAPPGYGKMDIVDAVAAADSARCITIDLANCRSAGDVARRIVSAVVLDDGPNAAPVPATIVAFTSLDRLTREDRAIARALARWIVRLARSARTFVVARRRPAELLDALAGLPVLTLGPEDLAVDVEREREQITGVPEAWTTRYALAFGAWPRAWERVRAAALRPRQRLRASDIRELTALVRSEIDGLDAADRPATVALAAFGRATADEIAVYAGASRPGDIERSLAALEGFVARDGAGGWRMFDFPRQVLFERREPADAALAARVILGVAGTDAFRALVMALEAREIGLISALLATLEPPARADMLLRAEARLGVEPFLIDDQLFIAWWETPRSRQRFGDMVAGLKGMRTFPASDVRWRRNLALALAQTESPHLTRALSAIEALLSLEKIGEPLRPLACARLAYGFAWIGDADTFGRLAPSLDTTFSDARRARLRYEYVRCVGDAVARRAVLGAMAREAAGIPYREREVAVSTALDAFFSPDPSRFEAAIVRLHDLDATDATLAAALSYIEGGTAALPLAVTHDPHLVAFATLVRAAREPELGERAVLLRAAIAHADLSSDVELRIATRLAAAYAVPDAALGFISDAERLARSAGSGGLQGAVACARRGEIDGPLLGLARRFGSNERTPVQFQLGVFDGVVRGRDDVPIALAERQLELMTFLSLHPDGWADRDAIVEAIWPDLAPQAGVGALKTAAHRARTALGEPRAIVPVGNGYRLSPAVGSDVASLETLLATPAHTVTGLGGLEASYAAFATGIERLRDRANRWPWFDRYAARIEGVLRRLATAIAQVALRESQFDIAQRLAADLRSLDDADETAFKIAVDAHRAAGNTLAAAREIERYSALIRSFGGEPVTEIARLWKGDPRR